MDRVPIKEILREPPKSRLRSRRPFVAEAARLASLNQTEQEIWEQSWIEGVPPGHDAVTNPTCPQPGFTLPRRQFVTLNRLRCGQARCAESLYRWGVIASLACPCGESHQTTRHIVEECPLTAFPGGLRHLHKAGPDAVKSAHSLHSLEACDIYTKRVPMQSRVPTHCIPWRPAMSTRSGSRCSQECPLIAFPGGLRRLHEAGPDAVEWLSKL